MVIAKLGPTDKLKCVQDRLKRVQDIDQARATRERKRANFDFLLISDDLINAIVATTIVAISVLLYVLWPRNCFTVLGKLSQIGGLNYAIVSL